MQDEERDRRLEHLARIQIGPNLTAAELTAMLADCADRERGVVEAQAQAADDANAGANDSDDSTVPPSGQAVGASFFDDYTKSVDKARMLYYVNSGLSRFQQYKDYGEEWDGTPIDIPGLQEEILEEGVTDEELSGFVKGFLKQYPYTTATLPACGACGLRIPDNGLPHTSYRRLYLTDPKAAPLKYTTEQATDFNTFRKSCAAQLKIPIDDVWNTTTVDLSKARSVYLEEHTSGDPTLWHLHPELVECDDRHRCSTLLCPLCTSSLQLAAVPKRSIAAGVDFGFYKRLNLQLPNLQEQHIISRTRLFFATLKVSSNTCGTVNRDFQNVIKCHAVFFTDNTAETAAYMFNSNIFGHDGLLDLESLKGMLQVAMLAPGGAHDRLFQRIYDSTLVTAKAYLCAQWLLVLQAINCFYRDLDVSRIESIKDVVAELNQHVKETTQRIVDPDIVAADQARGSDVAGVAHVEVRPEDEAARIQQAQAAAHQPPAGAPSEVPISYSFLADREEAYMMEDENDFRVAALTRLARLEDAELAHLGTDESNLSEMIFDSDAVEEYLARYPMTLHNTATRGAEPLSQFGKDDQLLGTCFPHIFLFGDAYHRPVGCLNQHERYHLLNQFTVAPAEDRRLMGLLFNVKQRREVIDGVRAYVDGRSGSLRALKELLENRGERARLRNAIKFPYSHVAKRLIRKYMKHLRPAGKGVAYGAVEGTTFKHQMLGCNRRYAPVTCFLTLSPANLDNPRSIRCCFRTVSNTRFPAVFEAGCPYGEDGLDFMRHMDDNYDDVTTEGVITLPLAERARKSIANPVAFVAENKRLLQCVLTYLLGVSPEARGFYSQLEGPSARKTHFYRTRKGVLGHVLYGAGVPEAHSRGTLHWHLNLAAGPSAFVLQRFAHLPEICDTLSAVLDTAYRSETTPALHVGTLVRKYLRRHRAMCRVPDDVLAAVDPGSTLLSRGPTFRAIELGQGGGDVLSTLSSDVAVQAANQQFHDPWHVPRCHQGLAGKTGCALSMPQGCIPHTYPVLLRPLVPSTPGEEDTDTGTGEAAGPAAPPTGEAPVDIGDAPVDSGDLPPDAPPDNDTPYCAVPMSALPHPDEVPAHHLVAVLDPSLPTTVIVWETKRPVIHATAFAVALDQVADVRAHVVSSLRTVLSGADAFYGNSDPFWHWLETTASELELHNLYNFVQKHLPIANGFLAAYNPGLSFVTASHNNVCLLGGLGQAKNAMFYLIPYSGKNKFPLADSLPILENALQHIQTFHSTAVDSGTLPRTIKHLLTRVLNRIHLQHEISDWQVAAALLEMPSTLMTDRFVYGNPLALAALRTQLELATNRRAAFNRMCDDISQGRQRATTTFHWNSRAAQEEWAGSDRDEATGEGADMDALAAEAAEAAGAGYDQASLTQDLGYIQPFDLAVANGPQDLSNPPRRILVPATAQYYFRGRELQRLTYEEFLAIVEFKNAKPSLKPDDPVNWKTQRQFRSDPRFVGYDSCYYVLRRKQCTPLFLGRTPVHPGQRPPLDNPPAGGAPAAAGARWEDAANVYARYYLNIYKPMHAYDPQAPRCTMQELERWVAVLQQAHPVVAQFRAIMIRQHVAGLRTSTQCQDMLRQYRNRARHLWNAKERSSHAAEAACNAQQSARRRRNDVDDADEFLYREWNGREANDIRERLHHDLKQQNEFLRLSGAISLPEQTSYEVEAVNRSLTPFRRCQVVQQIVHEISDYTEADCAALLARRPASAYAGAPLTRLELKRRDERIAAIRTSLYAPATPATKLPQQVQLLDQFIAQFTGRAEIAKLPQVILLHGAPGSGKTTLRDAIMEVATLCDCKQLRISYNHSNATEMGGQTVCSVIGNNATLYRDNVANFTKAQLQQLRDMKLSKSSLVVLEEVENNVPWGLARLSRACQFITGNPNLPFGGMTVLFLGDLTQLKSCMCPLGLTGAVMDIHLSPLNRTRATQGQRKVHLGQSLLSAERPEDKKYSPLHPYTVGTGVLTGSRWFELTEQQRSLDPRHTSFVTDNYKGRPITMDKVRKQGFRIFDEADAGQEEWIAAPVLVSTNRERYSLVHLRSLCYAKYYGIPVFRWMISYRKWRNKPEPEFVSQALDDPCFYQYFVQGCMGYLTDKVCVPLYLINGLGVKLHSMTFSDEHRPEMERTIRTAKPGYVYTLPHPPITVNVQLVLPSHTPPHVVDALSALSLERLPAGTRGPWRIVVPLHDQIPCKETKKPVLVRGGDGFGPSKVLLRSIFPYETNFALTVHRSLGVTLERGIIALSECRVRLCRFTYEQVHVAFSRFRQGSHVRLLLTGDSEAEKWKAFPTSSSSNRTSPLPFSFRGTEKPPWPPPTAGGSLTPGAPSGPISVSESSWMLFGKAAPPPILPPPGRRDAGSDQCSRTRPLPSQRALFCGGPVKNRLASRRSWIEFTVAPKSWHCNVATCGPTTISAPTLGRVCQLT